MGLKHFFFGDLEEEILEDEILEDEEIPELSEEGQLTPEELADAQALGDALYDYAKSCQQRRKE